jgi:hypothetical protein
MTGWLRLDRFDVVSDRLCAAGVFAGELLDSDGTSIGVGSRRRTVPAEIARSLYDMVVVIGPVDVDLLGLTVSIPAFTVDTGVVRVDGRAGEAGPSQSGSTECVEKVVDARRRRDLNSSCTKRQSSLDKRND